MREATFWRAIKTGLKNAANNQLFLQRVDAQNVPDVYYSIHGYCGWIELKYIPKYPTRQFSIKHFTPGQKLWLKQYKKHLGTAWVLIRVEKDIYLIDAMHADNIQLKKEHLLKIAFVVWYKGNVDYAHFIKILIKDYF